MGTKKPRPICLSEEAGFADEVTLQRGWGEAAGSVILPVSTPGNGLSGLGNPPIVTNGHEKAKQVLSLPL
jgi:hypothetical protein